MNNGSSQSRRSCDGLRPTEVKQHCAFLVINLDRSPERLASMQKDFIGLGIPLQRVAAVDARCDDLSRMVVDRSAFSKIHGRSIIHPGEIGCYASHLKALSDFLATGKRFGLIMEDDVTPQPWLEKSLATLIEWESDWDIVPLFHFHRGGPIALQSAPQLSLTVFFGPVTSAAAYLVSRRAAAVLLEKLATMEACFDHALFSSWHHALRVRGVTPMPIRLAAEANVSTINSTPFKKPFFLFRIRTFAARLHVACRIVFHAVSALIGHWWRSRSDMRHSNK